MLRKFMFAAILLSSVVAMEVPASAFGGRGALRRARVYNAPVRPYYVAPRYYAAPRVSVGYGSYNRLPYSGSYRSGYRGYGYNGLGRSPYGYGGYRGYGGGGISIGVGRGGVGYGSGIRIGW